jgi:transcriptional regulator with XRE-family HTH domain
MENRWLDHKIEEYRGSFEFKLERLILSITEDICFLLNEKGLSKANLAELLGCSRAAITKMLNGTPNMTIKKLLSISEALGNELNISFPPQGFKISRVYISKKKPVTVDDVKEYREDVVSFFNNDGEEPPAKAA